MRGPTLTSASRLCDGQGGGVNQALFSAKPRAAGIKATPISRPCLLAMVSIVVCAAAAGILLREVSAHAAAAVAPAGAWVKP